jgi:hypothetical protein
MLTAGNALPRGPEADALDGGRKPGDFGGRVRGTQRPFEMTDLILILVLVGSGLTVIRAFVKVNPVTYLSDAERALLVGGPAAGVVVRSPLWALGIFLVFAPLAVAMYRRRI